MNSPTIISGPWTKPVIPKQSLDHVIEAMKSYLETITATRQGVEEQSYKFNASHALLPVDCKRTIEALDALREPITSLCELFSDRDHLPESLALLRYQILVPLHYTNEQVKEIVPLVSLFRSHCLKSSLQTIQHQQIIADKMEQLSRASEEIEVEGYRLIDQVRFTFNDN